MHQARNRNLGGHRDYLEEAFFAYAFPRQGQSVRPSDNTFRYLINQIDASLSEAPRAFHREGGEFSAALVK